MTTTVRTTRARRFAVTGAAATLAAALATTLAALHLVAAAVMIPALARSLRTRTD
ncbi:hypothetical protein [Actinoplanes solisilvae]|uniref:hypothetical protein n=1 Tax=Actinoplanes solisilvae TaxID=2486853 RepID=UPI0013E35A9E|nr:hypothetical protein [Actinoplanes solisilvae]